jgi:chromosome segregation ATPase
MTLLEQYEDLKIKTSELKIKLNNAESWDPFEQEITFQKQLIDYIKNELKEAENDLKTLTEKINNPKTKPDWQIKC